MRASFHAMLHVAVLVGRIEIIGGQLDFSAGIGMGGKYVVGESYQEPDPAVADRRFLFGAGFVFARRSGCRRFPFVFFKVFTVFLLEFCRRHFDQHVQPFPDRFDAI